MELNSTISRLEENPDYLRANWSLKPEEARLLYLIASIGECRSILEVGTSIGYSTMHLAMAASPLNGHVITIDASAERQAQALEHLKLSNLSECVTLMQGEAIPCMETLVEQGKRFDLIFLDAQKSEYVNYLDLAETLLNPQGLLFADNTRSHREQMNDFIEKIHASEGWELSDVETPNGFILARKRSA